MATVTDFKHWSDVPDGFWQWPNFSPQEIACRGDGKLKVHGEALDMLEDLRSELGGKPMIVRSAYRSPEHNRAVGGAARSQHLNGVAFDIAMTNHDPHVFEAAARRVGFLGFGFYPEARNNFMHIDLGPARQWGTRWPANTPSFAAEPPPPKPLSKSRTIKGAAAGGLGTTGAAAIDIARDAGGAEVLADTLKSLSVEVQPLAVQSGFDSLQWVFLGLAFAGAATAAYARWDDWRKLRK